MRKELWFLFGGMVLGLICSRVPFLEASPVAPTAQAKCDYTLISETGSPNIGKDGLVKYDAHWKAVVEAGWALKVAVATANAKEYIFEKCE
jgi:hypothetical protein